MARRRRRPARSRRELPGDPNDPRSFARHVPAYLEALAMRGYSRQTIDGRGKHLDCFVRWAAERSIGEPAQVTRPILERYQRWLFYYRKASGKPLSFATQNQRIVALRGFFRYMARENLLLYNPASEIETARCGKRLPAAVLTASEVERLFEQPDLSDPFGLRDRAILEVFYSTGMRRNELIHLALHDVDYERGTVTIRCGKGNKDRVVPIGDRALYWLDRYLVDVRPELVTSPDCGSIFLTFMGASFAPDVMSRLVRAYVDAAQLGKTGSCHLLRHSCATLMLDAGADIRYVQEMLGHASVATTQIYTHVSIRALKAIHAATHPGAGLGEAGAARVTGADEPVAPAVATSRDELLSALTDEEEGETDE